MNVRVKLFASLQQRAGVAEIQMGATDVGSLLRRLAERLPAIRSEIWEDEQMSRLSGKVKIMVNGRSIDFMEGLATMLNEGDRVAVFPPVGGG